MGWDRHKLLCDGTDKYICPMDSPDFTTAFGKEVGLRFTNERA